MLILLFLLQYDSRFGDAFWNSSKDSMIFHIFRIMTSWALVVDVWYLPPMKRLVMHINTVTLH
jgi:glycerol-3-phosphate O-acyltransferase 3/4